jgi:hypothetical protein
MHYFAAAVIPEGIAYDEAEPYVAKVMAPWNEKWTDDGRSQGLWDWWVVGGRWTGVWAEYDPTKDPRNLEPCTICGGSGVRPGGVEEFGQEWFDWCHGCNGCLGKGQRPKHPPRWVKLEFDLVPVERFLEWPRVFRRPITLISEDAALEREPWDGENFGKHTDEEWEAKVQAFLAPHRSKQLIVVDYHS